MTTSQNRFISFVIPVYNEAAGLKAFHESLVKVVQRTCGDSFEIIYCDDGSTDTTPEIVRSLCARNKRVKLIKLTRNFNKENALSAGIAEASGNAIITLDGDGQHPVELIPKFLDYWRGGAQIVVGVRTSNTKEGFIKRFGSLFFYKVFNALTGQKLIAGSSDFRLIDRSVQQAFLRLRESERLTRSLIDWLGFKRETILFKARPRQTDKPGYSFSKLFALAANSFVSMTPTPLYIFGCLGVFITCGSFMLGGAVLIEQLLLGDPWQWRFTGTAMLGILILFLVGVVLTSQGILALYIAHIHSQTKRRPLFIIDYEGSAGIKGISSGQKKKD